VNLLSHSLSNRLFAGGLCLAALLGPAYAQPPHSVPAPGSKVDYLLPWFSVPMGNEQNHFFKNEDVAVHLLASSRPSRLIAAFPGGNSGVGVWFKENATMELAGLEAAGGADFQAVQVSVRVNQRSVLLKKVILDSLRMLRSDDLARQAEQARRQYALAHQMLPGAGLNKVSRSLQNGQQHLVFERHDFGIAKPYQAEFIFPPETRVEQDADGWRFTSVEDKLAFQVRFQVPFATMHPIPDDQLFNPAFERFWDASHPGRVVRDALRNFKFLAFREKLMAGSWQYLTYFGRDTSVTLLLLEPILSGEALQDGLQSLVDRTSDQGKVAHEEEVGSLDELDRIREGSTLDPNARPHLDHKMVDSEFFLPLVWAAYARHASPAAQEAFLSERNQRQETNRDTMVRNFGRILKEARRFASNPRPQNLVALEPGVPVGNWRDSTTGIGNGRYPADINLWLMPAALDAIGGAASHFRSQLPTHGEIARLQRAWRQARPLFEVDLSVDEMRSRVRQFLADSNRVSERQALMAVKIGANCTVAQFLAGQAPAALAGGLRFPAISLDAQGKPIPIMHSDAVFGLLFDRLDSNEVRSLLRPFQLPFPLGLRSEVGLLTANPAYDPQMARRALFSSKAYHGTVVWVWPQAMLELGLERQERRFRHSSLGSQLQTLLSQFSAARSRLGSLALSELYAFRAQGSHLVAVPYGAGNLSDTEANPIQLWSSVLPALYYVEHSGK
jgi:hypothetical protein